MRSNDNVMLLTTTRSYYRKESAASPQGNKGSMHNLLNKAVYTIFHPENRPIDFLKSFLSGFFH